MSQSLSYRRPLTLDLKWCIHRKCKPMPMIPQCLTFVVCCEALGNNLKDPGTSLEGVMKSHNRHLSIYVQSQMYIPICRFATIYKKQKQQLKCLVVKIFSKGIHLFSLTPNGTFQPIHKH